MLEDEGGHASFSRHDQHRVPISSVPGCARTSGEPDRLLIDGTEVTVGAYAACVADGPAARRGPIHLIISATGMPPGVPPIIQ